MGRVLAAAIVVTFAFPQLASADEMGKILTVKQLHQLDERATEYRAQAAGPSPTSPSPTITRELLTGAIPNLGAPVIITDSPNAPSGPSPQGDSAAGTTIGRNLPDGRGGLEPRVGDGTVSNDGNGSSGGKTRKEGTDVEDLKDRGKNLLWGVVNTLSGIITFAGGLSAITAEGGSFMGKLWGGIKTVSGLMGMLNGGNQLYAAVAGKYFLPDSMRTWGTVASVLNGVVALKEVTGFAFGKLGDAWGGLFGKDKKDKKDEDARPRPNEGTVTAAAVSNDLDSVYRFNCASGGSCFLSAASPAQSSAALRPLPADPAARAFVNSCRNAWPMPGMPPAWWDATVCNEGRLPPTASADQAPQMGRDAALRALQKGDAYWGACVSHAPGPDTDGTFYGSACGNRWVVDARSGQRVPVWMAAGSWQQARDWGHAYGSAAR